MREMMRDLNHMLRSGPRGDEPDFEAFKQKWGQHFPGVESLDELLEQIGQQAGQMQSLLAEHVARAAPQLQDMMQSLFMQDERLEAELAPARHEPRPAHAASTSCAAATTSAATTTLTHAARRCS